jgi:ribose 5-phosphate isomerase B
MIIYLGADHRGFYLKEKIKDFLKQSGYEVADKGNSVYDESDDYPDFAASASREVAADPGVRRGILFCGSGVGVDIVANKFNGIRSVLGINPDQVYASRHDDDANILSLPADFIDFEGAKKMVGVFLQTPFSEDESDKRRRDKIRDIEEGLLAK